MEKKLPNVFANPIEKKMQNVQNEFYSGKEKKLERSSESQSVEQEINEIFSSKNFVYKKDVSITTLTSSFDCTLVGKTDKSLLTMEGKVIPIASIVSIQKK